MLVLPEIVFLHDYVNGYNFPFSLYYTLISDYFMIVFSKAPLSWLSNSIILFFSLSNSSLSSSIVNLCWICGQLTSQASTLNIIAQGLALRSPDIPQIPPGRVTITILPHNIFLSISNSSF